MEITTFWLFQGSDCIRSWSSFAHFTAHKTEKPTQSRERGKSEVQPFGCLSSSSQLFCSSAYRLQSDNRSRRCCLNNTNSHRHYIRLECPAAKIKGHTKWPPFGLKFCLQLSVETQFVVQQELIWSLAEILPVNLKAVSYATKGSIASQICTNAKSGQWNLAGCKDYIWLWE